MTRRVLSPWRRSFRAVVAGLAAVAVALVACDTAAPSAVEAETEVAAPAPEAKSVAVVEESASETKGGVLVKLHPVEGSSPKVGEPGEAMSKTQLQLKRLKEVGRDQSEGESEPHTVKVAPIVVLNGHEISAGELKQLDKASIESVEVFDGAASVAGYGERGRHGVIRIKIKK